MTTTNTKTQAAQFIEMAEHIRTTPTRRSEVQREASQHMLWTTLFGMSNAGCFWLAARHGRMDYIWVRMALFLPYLVAISLATQSKITWIQAGNFKTLGSLATAGYVFVKARERRDLARMMEELLSGVDKEVGK